MAGITGSTHSNDLNVIEMACEYQYSADFGYGDPELYDCGQQAVAFILTRVSATIDGSAARELLWQVLPLCDGHAAEAKTELTAEQGKIGGTAILARIDIVAEYHPDDCVGCVAMYGVVGQHSYIPFNHKREADRLAKLVFDESNMSERPAWEQMSGLAWDGQLFTHENGEVWYHLGNIWVRAEFDKFIALSDEEWGADESGQNDGTYSKVPLS